jgi:hypothetical protein
MTLPYELMKSVLVAWVSESFRALKFPQAFLETSEQAFHAKFHSRKNAARSSGEDFQVFSSPINRNGSGHSYAEKCFV